MWSKEITLSRLSRKHHSNCKEQFILHKNSVDKKSLSLHWVWKANQTIVVKKSLSFTLRLNNFCNNYKSIQNTVSWRPVLLKSKVVIRKADWSLKLTNELQSQVIKFRNFPCVVVCKIMLKNFCEIQIETHLFLSISNLRRNWSWTSLFLY